LLVLAKKERIATASVRTGFAMTIYSLHHALVIPRENFSPPLPVAEEGGLEFPQPHRLHKR